MIKTNKQPLPHEEQLELVRRAQAGCVHARNLLLESNLPLIHMVTFEEPRDIDLRKKRKPKKGHFRETFGEAGKKHWQK